MNCICEGCQSCISSFFWLPSLAPREKKRENKALFKSCLLWWIIFAASRRLWHGGQSCIQSLVGAAQRHLRWWLSCVLERKNIGGLFANEFEGQIRQQFDHGILFCQAELLLLWQMWHSRVLWACGSSLSCLSSEQSLLYFSPQNVNI